MALTALELCTRALLRIGAQAIASLDEGTAEAEIASDQIALFRSLGGGWEQAPAVHLPTITRSDDAAR